MSWICPHCGVTAILKESDFSISEFELESGKESFLYSVKGITCPNPDCKLASITLEVAKFLFSAGVKFAAKPRIIQVIPSENRSRAKNYPSYIPHPILEDYQEACAIVDLSPKASATLARRALQGMIRDFWGIKEDNLNKAIKALQDKVSSDVWEAIDGIRTIGNIGAHMEKDINIIVEVNPDEAGLLIEMIEMFLEDWYIAKHDREQRIAKMRELAAEKKAARKQ